MKKPRAGFTIVELLIVIVVIAILAAISIVAYNGIQNRANDTVVQNDITNFAKQISLYEAEKGSLPQAGSFFVAQGGVATSTDFPSVPFHPSKSAYSTAVDNFFYCNGKKSGVASFVISGTSKSGAVYVYSPDQGLRKAASGTSFTNCFNGWDGTHQQDFGYSYGYYSAPDTWWSWTN